jgi:mannose-6-phosphate isomerase class I
MEAMVNSDNVVRGGLTPKYKDTKTLVEMLKYKFQDIKPTGGIRDTADDEPVCFTRYPTGY